MIITFKERKELFKNECKVINLEFEYESCVYEAEKCLGDIKWAIITELNENELLKQYGDVINKCYSPYVLLNGIQGATIADYHNLEAKHRMRCIRSEHVIDINDEYFEYYVNVNEDIDVLEEIILKDNIKRLRKVLCGLNKAQKRRVIQYYFYNKTYTQIAEEEGISRVAIKLSISAAIKKIF